MTIQFGNACCIYMFNLCVIFTLNALESNHFSSSLKFPQKGNIFLVDYKLLDGVETNTINGKKQFFMAPLVLLHKTPDNQLMPIAIQVGLATNISSDEAVKYSYMKYTY